MTTILIKVLIIISPHQHCDIVDLRGIPYFCCEKMNYMVQIFAAYETQKRNQSRVVYFLGTKHFEVVKRNYTS